jgi:hypothetical protein
MPFRPQVFEYATSEVLGSALPEALATSCSAYAAATTPLQKARAIEGLMVALDRDVPPDQARAIMQRCACIGQGVIDRALALQREARDLDDLLARFNAEHIGGGHLRREGTVIHAAYDHCYCGSVNKTKAPISTTYCACSCGWFAQLFKALVGHPVEVALQGSIIRGDDACRFLIHLSASQGDQAP